MWKWLLHPTLVMSLAATMAVATVAPATASALPSESVATVTSQRDASMAAILKAVSRFDTQVRLRMAGIDPAELQTRLSQLDDSQLASVAQRAHMVNAAGDAGVGLVIGLLIVAILVVVLVKLMDKEIEIKDS